MIDLEELQEKVILIAVSTGEEDGSNASLDELEELAATAGRGDGGTGDTEP